MKPELLDGAPPGTIAVCHPSGWIQREIFTMWFKHFVSIVKPTPSDPVVLILDGHYSHTRNIDVIDIGRKEGVCVVCLPPHSIHKMQPLDVSFMSPLKSYYGHEIEIWRKTHPGRVVTSYQIAPLMGKAYLRSTIVESVNGFRKTGISPLQSNIFDEVDFIAEGQREEYNLLDNDQPNSKNFVLPVHISPVPEMLPTASASGTNNSSRRGSVALITGSPHKQKLLNCMKKKSANHSSGPKKSSAAQR
jgi:hypothetical protein